MRRRPLLLYAEGAYNWAMSIAKDERLALRLTARQKQTIEEAAGVLGRNVTQFSVEALTERAEEVLSDRPVFDVSYEKWDAFRVQFDQPVEPPSALIDLLRRPSIFTD